MELTFGTGQMFTSQRLRKHPKVAKLFAKTFGYTNVGNFARFTIFKKLINKVSLQESSEILDLGTGYGEYALSMAQAMPKASIHALDIDANRIKTFDEAIAALKVDNVKTHIMPVSELGFSDFDLIFSIDVFEHIAPDDMPFETAYDKLKPGGYFLVKIPNKVQKTIFPERYFEEHHDWLEEEHIGQVYDLEGLSERFQIEGFDIIHASHSDGWLSRFAWELAYLGKKTSLLTQLMTLPIAKFFIRLDRIFHQNKWGNAIQVIGQKPKP